MDPVGNVQNTSSCISSLRGIDDSLTGFADLALTQASGTTLQSFDVEPKRLFRQNDELLATCLGSVETEPAEELGRFLQVPTGEMQHDTQTFQQPTMDLDNLFGHDGISFPDDWSPLSPVAGDEPWADAQSESLSAAAQLGSSCLQSDVSVASDVAQGPTMSTAMHDAVFARNLLTNCDAVGIKLPWETEFYSDLFGDTSSSSLVPKMPISDSLEFDVDAGPQAMASAIASVAKFSNANPVQSIFLKCADDVQFHVKRQQLRDAAIGKLLIVIRHCMLASSTGRHIIGLGTDAQQQDGAYDIVDAVVGIRSSATLVKRANSLLSFLRWFAKAGISDVNPFDEKYIWMYFQHLRASEAPATRADSAMSAFRFAFHILGFECLGPSINSRRLVGICELMLSGKRMLRQAKPLSVLQIRRLHSLLIDMDVHIVDRAVIAYILCALYGRCRNSDLQMIHALHSDFNADGGFLIIETCNHKSGRKAALKTRLMPIIIPARGIDGSVWVEAALKAFECAFVSLENPIDGPLMHAPSEGIGSFLQRGFRSNEVSSMLRRFLELDEPPPGCHDEIISSHSLKATFLAWSSRFGLSPATRSMLGRHTSSLNETYAIYSRDLVCAPVAELQKVIDAVSQGTFHPDSQRSEFFRPENVAAEGLGEDQKPDAGSGVYTPVPSTPYEPSIAEGWEKLGESPPHVSDGVNSPRFSHPNVDKADKMEENGLENHADDSDSSSSNGDGLSSDDSDMVEPPARVKRFRAKIPAEEKWYVHSKSHVVHRFAGNSHNDVKFLVCGKELLPGVMVSIVDSEAQFDLRLNQVKVPLLLQRALKGAGVSTIPSLAYAFGQPGQPIPSEEFATWVRSLEPGATVGGVASLKRLLFESQTQLLADLKDKILNPEPLLARKVPAAEREARLSNLKLRLNGVIVEGHSEPAHAFLDLATQLFDQNVLRYIPLEKCYSRLTELSVSGQPQSKLLEVESSKVVVKDRELDHEATVQSSYQALEALKRRGLALEFAGVMSFTCHDRYVQLLFSHLNRDPPSGYNRCSVSQLLAADKAAWTSLIEKNVKPRPDAAGTLELDSKLEEALKSYEVSFTLLPLATKHQPAAAKPSAPSPSGKGSPSCDEFVQDAVRAGHPIGAASKLPSALEDALTAIRTMSLGDLAKHRHSTLVYWLGRAKTLAAEEDDFHRKLHKDLQGILAPKRLLLWKEMLSFYNYPDPGVFDEVVDGVELAGAAPFVPAFEPNFKPAAMTTAELASGAEQSRIALVSTVRSSGDKELDSEIFSKTMAELECGWLEGPFEASDLPRDAVAWSNFFDDFVTLSRHEESTVVDVAVAQFFKLLGWEVSSGDKDLPVSAVFKALGVEINLEEWNDGRVKFGNTERRVAELVEAINSVLKTKRLTLHEAQILRGRMQFAKAQLWGRSAKLCLSAITSHAYGNTVPHVADKTLAALEVFRDCLAAAKPREISAAWDSPVYVFTDASFSPEDGYWPCGLGGVLVDCHGRQLSAMSFGLLHADLKLLGYPPKITVIFEAELLALTVCLILWKKFLKHRPCVAYIDNNSTRDVAISDSARTSPGSQLVAKLLANEDACGTMMWFARVPSPSNIADSPSRNSTEGISAKFVSNDLVRIIVSKCLSSLS
eukprot:s2855_g13.t1